MYEYSNISTNDVLFRNKLGMVLRVLGYFLAGSIGLYLFS